MSSKRNGASNVVSSSEEDDGGQETVIRKPERKKKRGETKSKQTFRIYSREFVTSSNRDERKKIAITIALDASTTEEEIRDMLVTELLQLRGKW